MRLIDADALINKLDEMISKTILADTEIHYGLIRELVAIQPTIEPEVRHGRWMFHEQKNGYLWKCSNCKGNFDQQYRYCPFCGAKMYDDGGTISKERFKEITGSESNGCWMPLPEPPKGGAKDGN